MLKKMCSIFLILFGLNAMAFKPNPKFLSFGYQFSYTNINLDGNNNFSGSFYQHQPNIIFEGFLGKQSYYSLNFGQIAQIAIEQYVSSDFFQTNISNNNGLAFYNRVNPIQGYLGNVRLGKRLSLMPLGIDFDGLALNGTSFIPKFQQSNNFNKINLFSQFGYCFQLIMLQNDTKFFRFSYSYVFNQINNQNDGSVQKFDLYYTISDNNHKHLNLLAYYHYNNFIDRNNTVSFYQIGIGVNYGLNW